MALSPGTRLGPYEVLSAIGAGGMGEVYRARDLRLNRDVALKVLPEVFARDPQRMARFEREAKLLASLNHSNIAAIYGLEESGPTRALIMELVEGPTLADRIRSGAIPLDEAFPIAKQIAEAVEYANDRGVIHRDLKPANIKITPDGAVKVLDFGLAKAMSDDITEADISNSPTLSMAATRQGVILGTAAYMSPEQAKGKSADRRADVWAFGAVLYEMLTGKQAFDGEDVTEVMVAVMAKDPAFDALPTKTPAAIRNLVRRSLEKNLKRRLSHIAEARMTMEDVISGATADEPTASATQATPISRLAFPGVATIAAVSLIALGALSFVHFRERPPAEAQPVRFSIGPPGGGSFTGNPQLPIVSPDGSKLAFAASAGSSKPLQLWIRALDSETAQALPGTDTPTQPFWSADSRYLAFYADGKLKKIAVSGGPAQTLSDVPDNGITGFQGDWNLDGVVLFTSSGTTHTVIYRVSAAGGKATPVTALDTSRQETAHMWPHFLPDGNHFLYCTLSTNPENNAIYVGSLDSKERKLLLNALSNVVYVPPGYLLFNREGTLMAQPFDANRFELTGDAVPIAEDVQFNPAQGRTAFAASNNGVLAYRTGAVAVNSQLVWLDRSGKRIGTLGEPGAYGDLELSPDGKQAAVSIADAARGTRDIWLYDVTRALKTRFTFDPASELMSVWSPDGSHIVFNSNRKGTFNLYQKTSNGSGTEEVLLEDNGNNYLGSWSPDGRSILYTGGGAGSDLLVLPVSGEGSTGSGRGSGQAVQGPKPIPFINTKFVEGYGRFSPDGRWVAYVSNESGKNQVYVAPYPGPGGKRQVSTEGGAWPKWRRDGSEIFYLAADNKLMAAAVNGKGTSLEVGAVKPLFDAPRPGAYRYHYDVTADGQRFLVNTALEQAASTTAPITVVVNWLAGLKK